jgi:hypothetical protein
MHAMFKRLVIFLSALALVLGLLVSAGLWFVLARWVPAEGKALLIQRLEQQWPIEVDIGAMRYGFLQGLRIEDLHAQDALSQETLLRSPLVRAHINWLDVALTRHVGFRSRVQLEAPCRTELTVLGRYALKEHDLTVRVVAQDIDRHSISGPLQHLLPSALTGGLFRLDVRYAGSPATTPTLSGRVLGQQVIWQQPTFQLTGRIEVEGTAEHLPGQTPAWRWDLDAQLREGALQGPPMASAISDLSGSFHLTPKAVDIEPLRGMLLGEEFTADGTLTLHPTPAVEIHALTRADLAAVSGLAAGALQGWLLEGLAPLEAVCRGPLQPQPLLDCAVHTQVQGVRVSHPRLTQPLTDIAGALHYDALAQELSMPQLRGRLGHEPFALEGRLWLRAPRAVQGRVQGTLPLDMLTPWLPAATPITQLQGTARVEMSAAGPLAALRYDGTVQLSNMSAQLTQPALRIAEGTAELRLQPGEIALTRATLRVNDQPLSVQGRLTIAEQPSFDAAVRFPNGQVTARGRLTESHALIEEAEVTLRTTALQVHGALARRAQRPSRLDINGIVELSELSLLPYGQWPALAEWKPQGVVQLTAHVEGPLTRWQATDIQARLRSESLVLHKIPLEQVLVALDQERGTLRARVPTALLADGKLAGEVTMTHRPAGGTTFVAQGDVVGLRLERLGEAIPAWKSQETRGTASLHVLMGGIAAQRPSWEGDGWVNANGTQLGSVRILELLFQGLFGVLADQLGLDMLRRAEITQVSAKWRLAQERFHTEDMRVGALAGTEPVALYGRGSVGFDQTLDFIIDPELSEATLLQVPTTSSLAGVVLKAAGKLETLRRLVGRHRLTGTIKEPHYRFEVGRQELLNELNPTNRTGLLQDLIKSLR